MTLRVEVPANTTATVRLPGAKLEGVTEGGHALQGITDISGVKQIDGAVLANVGSGSYTFAWPVSSNEAEKR